MEAVDAIVTWVDGADPVHAKKRALWQKDDTPLNSSKKRRFSDSDEIRYCLRSIRNHAPWVRTIWLVTDNQFPPSIDRALSERAGVRVVGHEHLFRGREALLPTFNSLSIEALLWRIEGLSERFIYFNDDVVLTRAVQPTDFFSEDRVILRGKWVDLSDERELTAHQTHKLNGARAMGFAKDRSFSTAHVAHPMLLSVMEQAFHLAGDVMERSVAHRFRSNEQLLAVSLHNHHAIATDRALLRSKKDTLHFSVRFCRDGGVEELKARLDRLSDPRIAMTCLNFIDAIAQKVPDVMERLSRAAGAPVDFEKPIRAVGAGETLSTDEGRGSDRSSA